MDWPGVESRESREALLRALSRNVTWWAEYVQDQLAGRAEDEDVSEAIALLRTALGASEREALLDVTRWLLSGLTHSALVAFDGGAADCPTMEVRDSEGRSLGDALHEEWPDFAPERT